MADLRETLAGEITAARVSPTDLAELASRMPGVAQVLLDLGPPQPAPGRTPRRRHGRPRHRPGRAALTPLAARGDPGLLLRRQNYLHDTDLAAEEPAQEIGVRPGDVQRVLTARVTDHGVRLTSESGDRLHHYDESARTMSLSARLRPGQRAFCMATRR